MRITHRVAVAVVSVGLVIAGLLFTSTSEAQIAASSPVVHQHSKTIALPPTCNPVITPTPEISLDPKLLAAGDSVKEVQALLGITVDGVFGKITAETIPTFLSSPGCQGSPDPTTALLLVAIQKLSDDAPSLTAAAQAKIVTKTVSSGPSPSRSGSVASFLECTKEIESHGNYEDVDSTQTYWGAYQFDQPTWDGAVTRAGHPEWAGQPPNGAPPAIQDAAAIQLYSERGNQPWGGRC